MSELYPKLRSNEWVQPSAHDYRLQCCDCGLVHTLDFRIRKGRVQYRARRNNRATSAVRRFREFLIYKFEKGVSGDRAQDQDG